MAGTSLPPVGCGRYERKRTGAREGARHSGRCGRRAQRRLVDDLKMHGQCTTEAEVHLRELVQVLEEAQAHLRAMEADAAGAILAGHETKLGSR